MRRPLRWQILLPMLSVTLATLVGVSGLNAWLSTRRTLREIEQQLGDVVRTLTNTNFPFSDNVLSQMHGLTGAKYAVTDERGELVASSDASLAEAPRDRQARLGEAGLRGARPSPALALVRTVAIGEANYFYLAAELDRRSLGRQRELLHIYYPEQRWSEAQREAVFPPLAVGGGAMLLVGLLSVAIAGRVTRPVAQLKSQVERIAEGDFRPLPLAARSDEIRELGAAINRMAAMLTRYEEHVRRTERLRTLGQLGGGVAHQMRNAATGCRMALDLHRRTCNTGDTDENLDVAQRQLTLMEQHLRRYLALGRSEPRERRAVDLDQLVLDVLPLVRHTAEHLGVRLEYLPPPLAVVVEADAGALQQVIVNLLLNAIEAASAGQVGHIAGEDASQCHVSLTLTHTDARRARIRVADSGPGPRDDVAPRMFEPLVSDKADGAGLGLAVAREIVEHHGGTVAWRREAGETVFQIELPSAVEAVHGTTADR